MLRLATPILALYKPPLNVVLGGMSDADLLSTFSMPKASKITGRSSSITNAFVNAIVPKVLPNSEQIESALKTLRISSNMVVCCYCGDTSTEWDHLRPVVRDKKPTGYISEIANLVPACGKCNQSKGNKDWDCLLYTSPSPRDRTRSRMPSSA